MIDRVRFYLLRLRQQLWIRPFVMCLFSVSLVFLAKFADDVEWGFAMPFIAVDTTEVLLEILAASMLVIATFAVGSMVSSYASASTTATPRTFPLVVSDDVSQNALSGFIGAFIFSIVALVAVKSDWYERPGHFVIFCLTLLTFAVVILVFVRWVDSIARLGRMGNTIEKVEAATLSAMRMRKRVEGCAQGRFVDEERQGKSLQVLADTVGYVRRVDLDALQDLAKEHDALIKVSSPPGTFVAPGRELACVASVDLTTVDDLAPAVKEAFLVGRSRTFEEDPRLGLVVLSEIAGRALSPALNDPGTAIDVVGILVRLLLAWDEPTARQDASARKRDRVCLPEIPADALFHDAFTSTARDGAGTLEVAVRLQEAFADLATGQSAGMQAASRRHAELALKRAEQALTLSEDLDAVRAAHRRFIERNST